MGIETVEVKSRKDIKKFIALPFKLYKGNPYWVPALWSDEMASLDLKKNPASEFCRARYWLAYRDGKPVGRIAGIINDAANKKWKQKLVRFGWLDVADDFEAAKALLERVENWAKEEGMEGVHGPLGFTDLDREGMLIEGFDELVTLASSYNFAYLPEFMNKLAYKKDVDWLEYELKVPESIPDRVLRVSEILAKRSGVRILKWKKSGQLVKTYGKPLFDLIDEAYSSLYGTTPLTERQVKTYIKQYLGFVDPRFTKILVDEEEKLVGFGISMPSLSRALQKAKGRIFPFGWWHLLKALKNPEVIDMYLVAVRHDYISRGVLAILMLDLNQSAIKEGVKYAETNLNLEDNVAVQQIWADYEKRQHKRRRAFIKMF